MIEVTRTLIGLEDLLLGFGKIEQYRGGEVVSINKINASNIPIDTNGKTLADFLDAIYQRFGIDLSGIEPLPTNTVSKEYVDLGVHHYNNSIAYNAGSIFIIDGKTYLALVDIVAGQPVDISNLYQIGTYQHSTWNSTTEYLAGDIVSTVDNTIYCCRKINIGEEPSLSPEFWELPKNDRFVEYWTPKIRCIKDRLYLSPLKLFYIAQQDHTGINPDNDDDKIYWRSPPIKKDTGNVGTLVTCQIPYEKITEEHPDVLPLNGLIVKANDYLGLYNYCKRNELIVTKAEYDSDPRIKNMKYWHDEETDEFGMRDLTLDSPFPRSIGSRSTFGESQEDLVKSHTHSTNKGGQGFGYGKVAEGIDDKDGVNRGDLYILHFGGEENRPYSFPVSYGVRFI